jgi:hypothetical protein
MGAAGFEPATSACEADALPLSYAPYVAIACEASAPAELRAPVSFCRALACEAAPAVVCDRRDHPPRSCKSALAVETTTSTYEAGHLALACDY